MPLKKLPSATHFCKVCFQEFSAPSWRRLFGDDVPVCGRCFRQMAPRMRMWKVSGIEARSLYYYNEEIRTLLYQFKGCFDVELAPVFLAYQAPLLRLAYRGYTLVPAPSFAEKNAVRGFNHVELMFSCLKLPLCHAIEKVDDVKQANLHWDDRQKIGNHLRFVEGSSIAGKKILFIDDLFTTGATAKACCRLLLSHGAKKVKILVMGYTPERSAEGEDQEKSN
jgi:competence protein ComFC